MPLLYSFHFFFPPQAHGGTEVGLLVATTPPEPPAVVVTAGDATPGEAETDADDAELSYYADAAASAPSLEASEAEGACAAVLDANDEVTMTDADEEEKGLSALPPPASEMVDLPTATEEEQDTNLEYDISKMAALAFLSAMAAMDSLGAPSSELQQHDETLAAVDEEIAVLETLLLDNTVADLSEEAATAEEPPAEATKDPVSVDDGRGAEEGTETADGAASSKVVLDGYTMETYKESEAPSFPPWRQSWYSGEAFYSITQAEPAHESSSSTAYDSGASAGASADSMPMAHETWPLSLFAQEQPAVAPAAAVASTAYSSEQPWSTSEHPPAYFVDYGSTTNHSEERQKKDPPTDPSLLLSLSLLCM